MRVFLALVLCFFCSLQAQSTIVKRYGTGHAVTKSLDLDDLIAKSGYIFKGIYLGSNLEGNSRKLKFKILDPIRGVESNEEELTLKEWAQVSSPFGAEVKAGRPYVFFFYKASRLGFTSLIGQEQGLVDVTDENKPKFAKRLLTYERRNSNGISGVLQKIKTLGRKQAKAAKIKSYTELRELCKVSVN